MAPKVKHVASLSVVKNLYQFKKKEQNGVQDQARGVSFPRFKICTIVQKLTSIVKHVASSFGLLRCKNAIRFCDLIYPYMGPIVSAQLHSAYLVL